ncbi:MAG: HU family DNA-binding protein [Oscillospiraceae bacterium]|nr:HU family DNA-binding protein [Oscillospiraceae bacterium]
MNRKEFVKEVFKSKGLSKTRAYHSVNAVMDTIRMALLNGDEVEIGGFGTFAVVTDLKGERIPVFKAGRALKSVLNMEDSD